MRWENNLIEIKDIGAPLVHRLLTAAFHAKYTNPAAPV